ncbi:transposase (plasmid) [Streptomyces chartreusis]|nr:transposase [Streptomyces chartreusis]WTA33472.1 transposase [Streptomyces chartreusis]
MSLEARADEGVPELTARVVRAAFPKGTLAVRVREALGPLFQDAMFAEAFPQRGRPAVSPGVLALVSVLQYVEGLTDRQAADQVRARMDWKFLLGLELDDPGFDPSVLSLFRARLIKHGLEQRTLELVLERLRELGLLKAGGRQREQKHHRNGSPVIKVFFSAGHCRPCPRQVQCSKPPSGRRGRGLTFLPRERYEALEAVRQAQDTDEWKDRYAIRAGVEGTISQAVRVTGLRRTRYRNLPATRLGHVFAATALNIIRIDRWLTGTPLGGTRTSHLEALTLAA